MAPEKTTSKATLKGKFQCGDCSTEFSGIECPSCGNRKGNLKLGPDGLPQQDHKTVYLTDLDPVLDQYGTPLSDDALLRLEASKMATEEFKDNLMTSRVNMSEIKKIETEKKLRQKRMELKQFDEGVVDSYPPVGQQSEAPMQSQASIFGVQPPQAQFMSKLMNMDGESRAEFIDQLSDADPGALNMLNSMFVSQAPQQMPGYGGPMGMMPQYYGPPPQVSAKNEPSSIELMTEMFTLFKEMQPKQDNSMRDIVTDLKDEFKIMHQRIDSMVHEKPQHDDRSDPILRHIQHLEAKLDAASQQPGLKDQLGAIKEMVDDFKALGLIPTTSPDTPIKDQIEFKRLDHEIDMEKKKFEIDSKKTVIEEANQKTQERLVTQLFSKALLPSADADIQDFESQPQSSLPSNTHKPEQVQQYGEVVEVIETPGASIREVRSSEESQSEQD